MIPSGWHAELGWKGDDGEWKPVYANSLVGPRQDIAPCTEISRMQRASQIAKALNNWRRALLDMPTEQSKEYTMALDGMTKATARFHLFESIRGPKTPNDLDQFTAHVHILPLDYYDDLRDCPTWDLEYFRNQCWNLLDPILGFVYDRRCQC